MAKRKTTKVKTSRSARSLPARVLSAKKAGGVKGGFVAVEHGENASAKTFLQYKLDTVFITK
jgi:hypothetical protein